MDFKFWVGKKPSSIFSEFVTKGLAESAKALSAALITLVASATPIGVGVIVGGAVGAGVKGMMDSLLAKSADLDKKIDRLLKEPLLSGISFLREGLLYNDMSAADLHYKDDALQKAHHSLTTAKNLVLDSQEDLLFVKALDLVALSAHSTGFKTAKYDRRALRLDAKEQEVKVRVLEIKARRIKRHSDAFQRFLGDPWRDKPMGYTEQRLYGRQLRNYSENLNKEAQEAREKIDVILALEKYALRLLVSRYLHIRMLEKQAIA